MNTHLGNPDSQPFDFSANYKCVHTRQEFINVYTQGRNYECVHTRQELLLCTHKAGIINVYTQGRNYNCVHTGQEL